MKDRAMDTVMQALAVVGILAAIVVPQLMR